MISCPEARTDRAKLKGMHKRPTLLALIGLLGAAAAALASLASGAEPPKVTTLVKPQVYERAFKEREVMVHASLTDRKHYEFYALMRVNAPLKRVRTIMTDYSLYPRMVPYIDYARFDEKSGMLDIQGGIFKFMLRSRAHFAQEGERTLNYRIVSGHFTGLAGRMFFEDAGEQGTLVYWTGAMDGTDWPPTFVIERGAEIVFGYTGSRMRKFIEKAE